MMTPSISEYIEERVAQSGSLDIVEARGSVEFALRLVAHDLGRSAPILGLEAEDAPELEPRR